MGYGEERPVIDCTGISGDNGAIRLQAASAWEQWSRFHITNLETNGSSSAAIFVNGSDSLITDIWFDKVRRGPLVVSFAHRVRVQDCVAWEIGSGTASDPDAQDIDGFSGISFGANGNSEDLVFARNIVFNGPDDGFDLWRAKDSVIVDCVSVGAGKFWNGIAAGDGNGFKMGGMSDGGNAVIGSLAVYSQVQGFDCNGTNGQTYLHLTAYENGGAGLLSGSGATVRDVLSIDNGSAFTGSGTITNNSWQLSITDPMFGNPLIHDLSLLEGSPAIDAGFDGGNLGASDVALALFKKWANHPMVVWSM